MKFQIGQALIQVTFPGPNGPTQINLSPATPLFVMGRNGTGKSALVHYIQRQLGDRTIYLPGSRTAMFDGEGIGMTANSRRAYRTNSRGWDNSPETRWRSVSGNTRNEKAIHDVTTAETQYKVNLADKISLGDDEQGSIIQLKKRSSPIERVNLLLEQANIPVRVSIADGELKCKRESNVYSIAKMSDGERIALIMVAEVIAADEGSFFVLDEPELHLHRAIIAPLIAALICSRPTCVFTVSTHELELPSEVSGAQVCIVRSATWNTNGDVQSWETDLIADTALIPEDVRTDLLGSRRKILFTEGTEASLDLPMYAVLFPKVSVRPKGGCRQVANAVAGMKASTDLHRTDAYGLVDNDGMSSARITAFEQVGVYALSIFANESIYYAPSLIRAVASRHAETANADEKKQASLAEAYFNDAKNKALDSITADQLEQLASRVAERQLRDGLLALLPKKEDMIAGQNNPISVSLPSPFPTELARLKRLIASKDLDAIVSRYPIKATGILNAVAKALRFQTRADYEAAALARIQSDKILFHEMRNKLQPLAAQLI